MSTRPKTNLEYALDYASRGWPVFPVTPNAKHPLGRLAPHGAKDATTDADTITRWWTAVPDANVGIATGAVSGVYVVDIDDPNALTDDDDLPMGPRVATPRGSHLYFAHEDGLRNTAGKVRDHVDTRGEGGYVLAPPSVVDGKRYTWTARHDLRVPRVPDWARGAPKVEMPGLDPIVREEYDRLVADIGPLDTHAATSAVTDDFPENVLADRVREVASAPEGTRNDTLNRGRTGARPLCRRRTNRRRPRGGRAAARGHRSRARRDGSAQDHRKRPHGREARTAVPHDESFEPAQRPGRPGGPGPPDHVVGVAGERSGRLSGAVGHVGDRHEERDPPTMLPDEVLTSAYLNAYVRDNGLFLHSPPACRVYHNADQSVPNATDTPLAFNQERCDTDGMHNTITNSSRITFNTAGVYVVTGHVRYAPNATGVRQAIIRKNGSTLIAVSQFATPFTRAGTNVFVSTIYKFAEDDYVELVCNQSSGGNLNVTASAEYSPEFAVAWVGAG